MIHRILDAIDALSNWTGKVFSFIIPAMMLVTAYEVVTRYVFGAPSIWALEATQYLFLSSTALGGAYVLRNRHHVNVSIVYDRLSAKSKALVEVITAVFFFAFILVLLWNTLDITIESVTHLQHSPSYWGPPIYPVYIIMSLGIILILVQGLSMFVRNIIALCSGEFDSSLPK
jgi:TRAP-type mannitol/chloroaromatic compound transport system permease small subunit